MPVLWRSLKPQRRQETLKALIFLCDLVALCEMNVLNLFFLAQVTFAEDMKLGLWCQVVNLSAYFLGIPKVFCHTPAPLRKNHY